MRPHMWRTSVILILGEVALGAADSRAAADADINRLTRIDRTFSARERPLYLRIFTEGDVSARKDAGRRSEP
jgi:hypothetical protein